MKKVIIAVLHHDTAAIEKETEILSSFRFLKVKSIPIHAVPCYTDSIATLIDALHAQEHDYPKKQ